MNGHDGDLAMAVDLVTLPEPPRDKLIAAFITLEGPFVRLIDRMQDGSAAVDRLTWTADDVVAHVISATEIYADILRGRGSPYDALSPDAIAARNDADVAAFTDRRPGAMAKRLQAAIADVLAELRRDERRQSVAYHAGVTLAPASVASLLLGEVAVHGHDVAVAQRRPWTVGGEIADLIMHGVAAVMPHYVDRARARDVHTTYQVHLRGQTTYTLRFDGPDLRVGTGWRGPVDCHISADPWTYLLAGYGRIGPIMPALTGGVVAYGRRPWLALRLPRLITAP